MTTRGAQTAEGDRTLHPFLTGEFARQVRNLVLPVNPPVAASSPWSRLVARLTPRNPSRRLRITREGKFFIAISLGIGFAAINTGNNLLYLLLGMLLALIIVSGILSELCLRDLSVTRKLPHRAQVGRSHLVEIEVFNHKGKFPSYAIEVEDQRSDQPADKRCFFLKISPQSTQVAAYRRTPQKRGRDQYVGFRVATRFPFGLFEKSREVAEKGELIIYPAIDNVTVDGSGARSGETSRSGLTRGHGDETLGLRPMRDGDDPRSIHWKKSATVGALVVREKAMSTQPEVTLALDDFRVEGAPSTWEDQFESNIREVASLSVAHLRRGNSVEVRTASGGAARARGSVSADAILRFLALLEPTRKQEV